MVGDVISLSNYGNNISNEYKWRIVSTNEYNNLISFDIQDINFNRNERAIPSIAKNPANASFISLNDFIFNYTSNNIEFNYSTGFEAGDRCLVLVEAIHKPTGKTALFEVFVKNESLPQSKYQLLKNDFNDLLGNEKFDSLHMIYSMDALDTLYQYDSTITRYSNLFKMPKEFVQTVLFREIWCYNSDDAVADSLVEAYYAWKYNNAPEPILKVSDSSTGLAQIFAATAINALNNAHDRGFITLTEMYDRNNWQDVYAIWISMHTYEEVSIRNCALVLLDCQYEFEDIVPYYDFYNYTNSQIKTIIARYNGTGDEAVTYAEQSFEYFEIFKLYN